jgi:hypothetical protein
MEEDEWEEFILEWVDALRLNQQYSEVHRCGGKGDMGRDIIGFNGPIGPQRTPRGSMKSRLHCYQPGLKGAMIDDAKE